MNVGAKNRCVANYTTPQYPQTSPQTQEGSIVVCGEMELYRIELAVVLLDQDRHAIVKALENHALYFQQHKLR